MTFNRLLNALPPDLYQKLHPHLVHVHLPQGATLHTAGEIIEELYFPIDCLLSITITMENGNTAETGVVGNREVLGVNAFMGGRETTQTEYVVQIAGGAMKLRAAIFREEFDRNPALRKVFLNYIQALIAQLSQTTACNRLHSLEQRLGRWLLEAQTRVESSNLQLTQQFVAQMLGVRRAGVTQAAQKLQNEGLITYSRGNISIVDQQGLESAACECFSVVRQEYDRLLGHKHVENHTGG